LRSPREANYHISGGGNKTAS